MDKNVSLFSNVKYCEMCRKTLPTTYEGDLCPACIDRKLFNDVKAFIRANTVNEYDVAEEFGISLRQVRAWIKEGRIEYCYNENSESLSNLHCRVCGEPIAFGSLCAKCMRRSTSGTGTVGQMPQTADGRMQFLDPATHPNQKNKSG